MLSDVWQAKYVQYDLKIANDPCKNGLSINYNTSMAWSWYWCWFTPISIVDQSSMHFCSYFTLDIAMSMDSFPI
jgi:hypothetical protein